MELEVSWGTVEERLREVAEGAAPSPDANPADRILLDLGLIEDAALSELGHGLYMARFVLDDRSGTELALGEVLKRQPAVTAFCEALWAAGTVPVSGAISLVKRLTGVGRDQQARRWLALMNRGGLIAYNRANPKMKVLYNPSELVSVEENADRERSRGHVIRPRRPYGNVLALRELLRAARGSIRWYEKHMGAKTLEVLYREIGGEDIDVEAIRLLSGPPPAEKLDDIKADFKRFRKEMLDERGIAAEWRVLTSREAFKHHGRFFITEGIARNLPPLNSILANSTDEILPSELTEADFDEWWSEGIELTSFTSG